MKVKRASLVSLLLRASMLPLSGAVSAQSHQDPRVLQQQPNCQQATPPKTDGVINTFAGLIRHSDGKYILEESASNIHFVLDDQQAAKKYKNRVVVITGTIDFSNKTIHVQKVEAAV